MRFEMLDGIFIAIVLISAILGWMRGLLREAIGLVCFAVALGLTYLYIVNAGLAQWARPAFRYNVAYVFAAATIVTFLIAAWVSHFGMDGRITTASRFLGVLFGIARGLLIFAIGVVLIDLFVNARDLPAWFKAGKSRELASEYMRLFWPKQWTGLRIVAYPYVLLGIWALFLSVVTDLIAALTRPFRLRLRR